MELTEINQKDYIKIIECIDLIKIVKLPKLTQKQISMFENPIVQMIDQ